MAFHIQKILFLISATRINKKGLVPLIYRITYKSQRKDFSTGLFINPNHWDSKLQKVKPPNEENTFINNELSLIKNKINQAFFMLQIKEIDFTTNDIYNQYAGISLTTEKTVLEIFDLHIKKQEKLIGIDTTEVSVAKFRQTKKHLKSFIFHSYRKEDYILKDLKSSFITEFDYYLKAEKKFKHHTIYKTIQRFRQIIKIAVALDYLDKDSFTLHRNSKPKKEIIYLTSEELKSLEEHNLSIKLQQIRVVSIHFNVR